MHRNGISQRPSRRAVLRNAGRAAALTAGAPLLHSVILSCSAAADDAPLNSRAGLERVTVQPGRTYLRAWAGYGDPPRRRRPFERPGTAPPPPPTGPAFEATWSKQSGPGDVTFADAHALSTTANFSALGVYQLRLSVNNGQATSTSTLRVSVEAAPPVRQLGAVYTKNFKLSSPFWKARSKALLVNWIPHCIDTINRTDLTVGTGGIDNFIEAGKALRGEPHGLHKGYVFSNAWVHQTVESMSIALMLDAQGDKEILAAQARMRATLDDWIPKILAAQEPDGYLQTAFTLKRAGRDGKVVDSDKFGHWDPAHREDHEGYVAGYFLESAINHYQMTGGRDTRLYNAAKKLADCWADHLGPAPKRPWYDGHQEMEQALVRLGRFVNDVEGGGKGQRYIELARYLLDSRYRSAEGPRSQQEYDQSHVPVVEQYEAVGHAVRAVYTYSGMADVAVETHDADYQSAVKSLWANMVNRKYYLTGGVGSEGAYEGFGENYSLGNRGYCEACSSCGAIFFHWKMNLAYHDASYIDLLEETMYNALLGSLDLDARYFYYDNPLDEHSPRYQWHQCPCCVGNIPRTLLMVPTWAYARSDKAVYVNLYIGSSVLLEGVSGTDVEMVQTTDYPWNGKVALTVNPKAPREFSLHVRVPNRGVSELYRVAPEVGGIGPLLVNGKRVPAEIVKGYAVITRTWKAGDRVEFELPLRPQRVHADPHVEAAKGKVAIKYGPLVYNIEQADQDISKALEPGSPLTAEWVPSLLGGVVVIKGRFADGSPMLAIPNFARMNREPGTPLPPPPPPRAADGTRPAPPPAKSVVWIREA